MSLSQINSMKKILARSLRYRIETMCWSTKMDLIAIGNDKGEVIVHRLNWQTICTVPSLGENIHVRAIAWQIDETIIAIAYSSGKIVLYDVEKADEIYYFPMHSDIKSIHWTKPVISEKVDLKAEQKFENFLSPLPNLNTFSSTATQKHFLTFPTSMPSILVISLRNGLVGISVIGVLPCGLINLRHHINYPNDFEIYEVQMGATFDEIIVYIRDGTEMNGLIFKNTILSKSIPSLFVLARKHGVILETSNYINDTVQCIVEAWETVLIEMDNKLTKYINSQPEGAVSADFLELLLFGLPSPDLEKFLTRDLTQKGLKKLGTSIDLSYSTMRNLIVKPLHIACTNLFYHLNNLKGLSKNSYYYRNLISTEATETAIKNTGSFLLKVIEFQQVIDQSAHDYKIFWSWLAMVMLRLLEDAPILPEELPRVTQDDIAHLADFINNFDDSVYEKEDGTKVKRKFHLDCVGQYLENENLHITQHPKTIDKWFTLLEENQCLKNSPILFPTDNNKSLLQEIFELKLSICNLFSKPHESIGDAFYLKSRLKFGIISPNVRNIPCSYYLCVSNCSDLIAISIHNSILFIQKFSNRLKVIKFYFVCGPLTFVKRAELFDECDIRDIAFYNESILSILLQGTATDGKTTCYFVQMPLEHIKEKAATIPIGNIISLQNVPSFNILNHLETNYFKPVEGDCTKIAVSGTRKISSILSDNDMNIRIYEMDIEDDDDEMDVSASQNDTSRD